MKLLCWAITEWKEVENVVNHLQKKFPGAIFKCVYESCAWGFELQRQLAAKGMECIVVHAADVSGSDKERKRKTDKVDAVKLARYHAAGLLEGIYVPDEELQKQRNLVRFRCKLTRDLTRSRNRLKSLLKYQGIGNAQTIWESPLEPEFSKLDRTGSAKRHRIERYFIVYVGIGKVFTSVAIGSRTKTQSADK